MMGSFTPSQAANPPSISKLAPVTMPDSARDALVSGRWDPIQELLDRESAIELKARELHYV